jgi:hypothetical protein
VNNKERMVKIRSELKQKILLSVKIDIFIFREFSLLICKIIFDGRIKIVSWIKVKIAELITVNQ